MQQGLQLEVDDTKFRRNAAANKEKDWATLDHAARLSVSAGKTEKGVAILCSLCAGADHSPALCALKSLQQATTTPPNLGPPPHLPPGGSNSPRVGPHICLSWNRGRCAFPSVCNFTHVCATCRGSHPAKDCADTPLDLAFKGPPLPLRCRPSDAH